MTAAVKGATAPGMVEVNVTDSSEVDHALNEAIEAIKYAATRHQTGIMVTRLAPGRYIVRAHPAVPFGLIREQHQ